MSSLVNGSSELFAEDRSSRSVTIMKNWPDAASVSVSPKGYCFPCEKMHKYCDTLLLRTREVHFVPHSLKYLPACHQQRIRRHIAPTMNASHENTRSTPLFLTDHVPMRGDLQGGKFRLFPSVDASANGSDSTSNSRSRMMTKI
jgi:hypothetical protein